MLETLGETQCYRIDGENPQERFFCVRCGTTVYWRSAAFAGLTGVAGGCFVQTPLPEPKVTVSNRGRCAWLTLPEDWAQARPEPG